MLDDVGMCVRNLSSTEQIPQSSQTNQQNLILSLHAGKQQHEVDQSEHGTSLRPV